MTRGLAREAALLESVGTRVVLVCPSMSELAGMGPNFMEPRRRLPALEAALSTARQGARR